MEVVHSGIFRVVRGVLGSLSMALVALALLSGGATAQNGTKDGNTIAGEKYIPTTWVDPDGCEHWVMDDGAEGYMDNKLTRDGKPICHTINTCAVMNTDQLFATDRASINAKGRKRLADFFRKAGAFSYGINGHTDSRASDEYNMRLSQRRAQAVARIALSVGANVASVRGYGEREPRASNATAAGMQQNRRVEIMCYR